MVTRVEVVTDEGGGSGGSSSAARTTAITSAPEKWALAGAGRQQRPLNRSRSSTRFAAGAGLVATAPHGARKRHTPMRSIRIGLAAP